MNTKISAGEVIVLTTGEYSSFKIAAYMVAHIDFDMAQAVGEFRAQWTGDEDQDQDSAFMAWLVTTERMVPVAHREMHISSYGELDEF